MMRTPVLALAAAAFLSTSALAYAQTTPSDQGTTKEQTQPATRSGAEPKAAPDEMKPGGGTDQNMRNTQQMQGGPDRDRDLHNTQMQGTPDRDRDQMQGGERPQGGEMLKGGEERHEGMRPLSIEQKTTLRETVLRGGPRLTHVSFRIGVGAVVPHSVRLVAVPQPILSIYPEWADDEYFVYGNEIIVVAPGTMAIVGVLPL